MFSATQFYHNAVKNALSAAAWGVSDIHVSYENGVDSNSLTKVNFDTLVPGNELVVAGKLQGDGESMVKIVLSYVALGSEQMSFTKYFNQAASKLDNGALWHSYSSRSAVNLEMTQYLDEWHKMTLDDDRTQLEDIIITRSLENNLLTPFVTLHVAKPGLRSAMKDGFSLSNFGDFNFRKRRDATEEARRYQDIKFRHRGKHGLTVSHSYSPVLCGSSELLAFPNEESDYVCFEPAELELDELVIFQSETVNVTGYLKYGQLNELYIGDKTDGIRVTIAGYGPKVYHKQGELETTLPFGTTTVNSHITTARFSNYTYVYFDDHMIGIELHDTTFNFEIGERDDTGFMPSKPLHKPDLHCFGRQISISKCSAHELVPAGVGHGRSRRGRKRTLSLEHFTKTLQRQM